MWLCHAGSADQHRNANSLQRRSLRASRQWQSLTLSQTDSPHARSVFSVLCQLMCVSVGCWRQPHLGTDGSTRPVLVQILCCENCATLLTDLFTALTLTWCCSHVGLRNVRGCAEAADEAWPICHCRVRHGLSRERKRELFGTRLQYLAHVDARAHTAHA